MIEGYEVIDGVNISELTLMPHHVLVRWLKKIESKGGILYPQDRQRKSYMVGVVLKTGPECWEEIVPGVTIQFDALCKKEFFGAQDPADRDTVFCMVDDDVQGLIVNGPEGKRFHPVHDFVLIEPDAAVGEENGLIVADAEGRERTKVLAVKSGRILAIGLKVSKTPRLRDLGLQVGDHVSHDAVTEFIMNEKRYVLCRADSILGVLEAA